RAEAGRHPFVDHFDDRADRGAVLADAVKPTSSILTERQSIDAEGKNVDIRTKGRHDHCVGIRAVPIGEAMVACAVADHYLRD
ncbi:chorismate synthase, partial [Rhizobium ruizarguesonis]